MSQEEDLLSGLLAIAEEDLTESGNKTEKLVEVDLFNIQKQSSDSAAAASSVVHGGETDSDDEQKTENYNGFGRDVKYLLEASPVTTPLSNGSTTWKSAPKKPVGQPKKPPQNSDVYTDPVFGIRIIKPLISSVVLKERMVGRQAVSMSKIKKFTQKEKIEVDWVVAGAIVNKIIKTSSSGNQYCIWTLSDLHDDLKTVCLFLFGSAYKEFWKTGIGTVVGVLNPTVFETKATSKDEATLKVDNSQRIMIFGQSKDFGTCRSTKKNGEKCTAFVNTNRCEYCIYHVKQEYQKCSQRSELQSSFGGRGLVALRNKVLGKNEVFYAGKSYTAIPAAKSKKLLKKDETRLQLLSGAGGVSTTIRASEAILKKRAAQLDASQNQKKKDLEILQKLGGLDENKKGADFALKTISTNVTLEESKKTALDVIAKLKTKKNSENTVTEEVALKKPTLKGFENGHIDLSVDFKNKTVEMKSSSSNLAQEKKINVKAECNKQNGANTLKPNLIDLSAPLPKRKIDRAKVIALKYIQKKGPIQKVDPNNTRGSKKRVAQDENERDAKRHKQIQENEFYSEKFKKMMAMTSRNADLLEQRDDEERDKYFDKMEKREAMEEKMSSTYKVPCKAVRCLKCKYTSFSAADRCKTERHPLKVADAVKRFFKCGDCGNRTVCLEIVPTKACSNCGGGKWERTTMMKERKVTVSQGLSIRGGEQKFCNSAVTEANINLLVPDE